MKEILIGLVGAILLVAAGVFMLSIHSAAENSVLDAFFHACGIMSIGLASVPLLLIPKSGDNTP
jgi:hypothetical protein